jgi:hypothetical protein
MSRRPIAVVAAATGLAVASAANSVSAAGVTVSPRQVVALPYWSSSSVTAYILVASATWNPPTIRSEGAIYIREATCSPGGRCAPQGSPSVKSFGEGGATPHTSESYAGLFAAFPGGTYHLTAKWRPYTPLPAGSLDGEKTSEPAVLRVPEGLPPRFKDATKLIFADLGVTMYAECGSVHVSGGAGGIAGNVGGSLSTLSCGGGDGMTKLSFDPVDTRFKTIAQPRIPNVAKVVAGGDVSAALARAFNDLFAARARGVGYAGAVITSINRAQGAYAKKQKTWEKKQMRAAGRYAKSLASAFDEERQVRPRVATLVGGLELPVNTAEDVAAFRDSLIRNGLPSDLTAGLARLGVSKADRTLVQGWLLATDFARLTVNPYESIGDPRLLAALRKASTGLRDFARKAERDPLHTGT